MSSMNLHHHHRHAAESSIRHAQDVEEVFNFFRQEADKNEKSSLELKVISLEEHPSVFKTPVEKDNTSVHHQSSTRNQHLSEAALKIQNEITKNEIAPPPVPPPPARTLLHYTVDPVIDYTANIEIKWCLGIDQNFFLSPLDEIRFYSSDSAVTSSSSGDAGAGNADVVNLLRRRNTTLEPVLSVALESVVADPGKTFRTSSSAASATEKQPTKPLHRRPSSSSSTRNFQQDREASKEDSKFGIQYDPSPALPNSSSSRAGTIKMRIPLSVLASSFLVCIYSPELRSRIVTYYIDHENMTLNPPPTFGINRYKDTHRVPPQVLPWPLKNLVDPNADSAGACYARCRSGKFGAVRRLDVDVALNVRNLFGFDGLNSPLGPATSLTQQPRPLEDVLAFRQIVERGIVTIQKITDPSIDSECGLVNPATILAPLSRAIIRAHDGAPADAVWDKTVEIGTVHFNFSVPLPLWILKQLYPEEEENEDDGENNQPQLLDELFEIRVLIPQYFPLEEVKTNNEQRRKTLSDPRLHQEQFLLHPEESIHTFQRCVLRSGPIRFHQEDSTQSFAKPAFGSLQQRNMEAERRRRQQQTTKNSNNKTPIVIITPPPLPYFPPEEHKHVLHLRGGFSAPGQLVTAVFDLDEKLLQQVIYGRENNNNTKRTIGKQDNPETPDFASKEYISGSQTHNFLLPNVLDRIDFFTFGHTEKFSKDQARESLEYAIGCQMFSGALRLPAPSAEGRFDIAYRAFDSDVNAPLARAITRPPFIVRTPAASIRILRRNEVESRLYPWLYDPSSSYYHHHNYENNNNNLSSTASSSNATQARRPSDDPRFQLMDWHQREEESCNENPLNTNVADYNYHRPSSVLSSSRPGTSFSCRGDNGGKLAPVPVPVHHQNNDQQNLNYLPEVGLWIEIEVSYDIASKDDTISIVDSLSNELVCLIKPAESDATFAASVDAADRERAKFVDDISNFRRLREDNIICVCRLDGKEIRPLRGCGVYAEYHSARLGSTLNRVGPFDLDDPQWALQLRTSTPAILPAFQLPALILDAFSEVPVEVPLTFRLGLPLEHRIRKLRKSSDAGVMFGGGGTSTRASTTMTNYNYFDNYQESVHSSIRTRPSTPKFPHPAGLPTGEESATPLNNDGSHQPLVSMKEATSSVSPAPGSSQVQSVNTGKMPSRPQSAMALTSPEKRPQSAFSAVSPVPPHHGQHQSIGGATTTTPQQLLPVKRQQIEKIERDNDDDDNNDNDGDNHYHGVNNGYDDDEHGIVNCEEDDDDGDNESPTKQILLDHLLLQQNNKDHPHYSLADAQQREEEQHYQQHLNEHIEQEELPTLRAPRPSSAALPVPKNLPPRRRPPSATPPASAAKTELQQQQQQTPQKTSSVLLANDDDENQNHHVVTPSNNNNNNNKKQLPPVPRPATAPNARKNQRQETSNNNNNNNTSQTTKNKGPIRPQSSSVYVTTAKPVPPTSSNPIRPQSSSSFTAATNDNNTKPGLTKNTSSSSVAPLSIQQGWDLLDYIVVTVHRLCENDSVSNPVWTCTPTGDADEWCSSFPGLPGASYVRPIASGSVALTNSRHLRLEFPPLKRPGRYVVRANLVIPTLPALAAEQQQEYFFNMTYSSQKALNPHEKAGQLLRAPFTLRVLCESTFRVTAASHHLTNYDQQWNRTIFDYMKTAHDLKKLPIFPFGNLQPSCLEDIPLALCSDLRRGENRSRDAKGGLENDEEALLMLEDAKSKNNTKNQPPSRPQSASVFIGEQRYKNLPSSVARKRIVTRKSLVFEEEETEQQKHQPTSPSASNHTSTTLMMSNNNNASSPSPTLHHRNREDDDQSNTTKDEIKKSTSVVAAAPSSSSLYTRSSMFEPPVTTLIPFSQGTVHGFLTGPKKVTTNDCIVITSHIADPKYTAAKDDVIVVVDDEWQVVASHRLLLDGSTRKPNNYQLCTVSLAPAADPGNYFAVYFSVSLGVGVLAFGPIEVDAASTYEPKREIVLNSDADYSRDGAGNLMSAEDADKPTSILTQHALRSYFAKSASNPLPAALHERMMMIKKQAENEKLESIKALDEADKRQEYYESPLRSSTSQRLQQKNQNQNQSHQLIAVSSSRTSPVPAVDLDQEQQQQKSSCCKLCAHDHMVAKTGVLRALLVGCDYRSSVNSTFVATGGKHSCGSRDVDLFHSAIKTAFGDGVSGLDVTTLKDPSTSSTTSSPLEAASTSPSAQNIRHQLLELIKKARFGDSLLFYFSGFGAILHGRGSTDPLRQVLVPSDVDWTAHRLIDLREIDAFARRAAARVGPTGSISVIIDAGFERGVFDEMDYVSNVLRGNATKTLKGPLLSLKTPRNELETPAGKSKVPSSSSSMTPPSVSPIVKQQNDMSSTTTPNIISPRPPSAGHLLAQRQLSRKTPLRGAPYSPAVYREAKEKLLQERADEVERRVQQAEIELYSRGRISNLANTSLSEEQRREAVVQRNIVISGVDDCDNEGETPSRQRKGGKREDYSYFHPLPYLLQGAGGRVECETPSKTHAATLRQRALAHIPLGARWKSLAVPVHLRAGLCDYTSMTRRFNSRDFQELPCARFRAGGTVSLTMALPENVSSSSSAMNATSSNPNQHLHQQEACEFAPIAIYFAGRRAVWQRPVSFPGQWLDGPAEDGKTDDSCSVFQAALSDALQSWKMSSLRHPTADNSKVGDPPSGLNEKEREAWETASLLAQPDRLRDFDAIARPPTWSELHKMIRRKLWSSPFRSQKPQLYVSHPRLLEDSCGMFPNECVFASTTVRK